MNLLRFIVLLILFYYLFKIIARYIIPYLLSLFIKRAQRNMTNATQEAGQEQRKKDGQVKVDYIPKKKKPGDKENLGDYTDFEEIKD